MQYDFEWDPAKARSNLRDHKVSFERASQVFLDPNTLSLDPNTLSIEDEKHSEDEDRWITLGMDKSGVLLVVCHTFREVGPVNYSIRLISARKPTKREAKQYHAR